MAEKKILAMPRGKIFLNEDMKLLKNHFEVPTAPTLNRKRPQIELSQNSLSSTGLRGKRLSSMDCMVIVGDRNFYDLGEVLPSQNQYFIRVAATPSYCDSTLTRGKKEVVDLNH